MWLLWRIVAGLYSTTESLCDLIVNVKKNIIKARRKKLLVKRKKKKHTKCCWWFCAIHLNVCLYSAQTSHANQLTPHFYSISFRVRQSVDRRSHMCRFLNLTIASFSLERWLFSYFFVCVFFVASKATSHKKKCPIQRKITHEITKCRFISRSTHTYQKCQSSLGVIFSPLVHLVYLADHARWLQSNALWLRRFREIYIYNFTGLEFVSDFG